MEFTDTFYIILFLWLAGEVLPWIIVRSRGIKLSFWEFNHPIIRKSLLAINHNNKVFDALQVIQENHLNITLDEIAELYNANMDFNEFVDAMHMAKEKNVNVSKDVLRELAFFKKDLREIIKAKNSGDRVALPGLAERITNSYISN
jgi:DNA-directed RNA polymerase subunit L